MNLIEESFQNKEQKKKKMTTRIILIAIILLVIIIIGIASYLVYIQSTTLRLSVDGQQNEKLKQMLVFENDGTIYVPIKEVASYFGYDSYNGEYTEKSEDPSKCYIESENEVANFTLGSNKIYKLDLAGDKSNYEYIYTKKPVKAIKGVLYATTEGIEQAFNISFEYDQDKNRISIFTIPYLVQAYTPRILDFGYAEMSSLFVNQKTLLQNMIVVSNKGKFGVIDVQGNTVIEAKYDNITYLPNTGDFLVESNKKVGILSSKRETKVQIIYDSLELMDSDAGLYVAKKDNKYGVIDLKGNIKIYIENDEIGIDISQFSENNVKSKYLLAGNLIPIRKDKYWGLFDKNGKQVVDFKYDSLGYTAKNNKEAFNLLVIPDYDVLVACRDKKYTLLNSAGQELFGAIADDIYMTISGGEKHYTIVVNDGKTDAEEWLDKRGIGSKQNDSTQNQKNTNTTNETNNTNNTNTNSSENNNEKNRNQENNEEENNGEENNNQENNNEE